jgi:hypothetical protein
VAAQLGVSVSTVRRMEFDALQPVADERGVWHFDPAEVARLAPVSSRKPSGDGSAARTRSADPAESRARAREGRVAARVFQMFARHWTLPQIVVATKQPPEHVRQLYHEWSTTLEETEWGG